MNRGGAGEDDRTGSCADDGPASLSPREASPGSGAPGMAADPAGSGVRRCALIRAHQLGSKWLKSALGSGVRRCDPAEERGSRSRPSSGPASSWRPHRQRSSRGIAATAAQSRRATPTRAPRREPTSGDRGPESPERRIPIDGAAEEHCKAALGGVHRGAEDGQQWTSRRSSGIARLASTDNVVPSRSARETRPGNQSPDDAVRDAGEPTIRERSATLKLGIGYEEEPRRHGGGESPPGAAARSLARRRAPKTLGTRPPPDLAVRATASRARGSPPPIAGCC